MPFIPDTLSASHPGRGDSRAIQERPADVRRLVSAVPLTGPITQKELTKRLWELERSGLVHRQVYAKVPPRVEYRLTDLGAKKVSGTEKQLFSRISLQSIPDTLSAL